MASCSFIEDFGIVIYELPNDLYQRKKRINKNYASSGKLLFNRLFHDLQKWLKFYL